MPRAKRGFKARRRRNKVLDKAEGFTHRRKNTIRRGAEAVDRAMRYAYRDRRARKRDFRQLWIARIGAAAVSNGLNYSTLIARLKEADIRLDRKSLSDLAIFDPSAFTAVVQRAVGTAAA
ncbi:MAG: 50S ribosomal protein L20 [Bdellovibrionota bacterium]